MLLEDQHGSEADRSLSASSNVDPDGLGFPQKVIPSWAVPGDKGTLPLAPQILNLVWMLRRESLQPRVEVIPDTGGVVDEIQALHLLDDGAEENRTCRVSHPSVELSVGLVRAQVRVAKIVARRLRFLREGHHIGRGGQIPVFVGPEFAGRAHAGLHLIDDEEHAVSLR